MSEFAFADVSGILRPRSIAVVGASDQSRNLGGAAVRNLVKFGFPGPVWPVHPKAGGVAGLSGFASLADLPGVPDLAILAIGAAGIPAALRDCLAAGIGNVIVWAGGFVEGGAEGAARQAEIGDFCREHGIRMLGPNCLGVFATGLPLTASFASFLNETEVLQQGGISVVGQSGGLVTMAVEYARRAGLGFRYAVSTGNEVALTAADFVAAFADDDATNVIAVYLEGTRDGTRLAAALELARARGKPVVLLRGGATEAAARAAAAHTGAVAGDAAVWRAVLDQLGVIQVRSLEELLDVVKQLQARPAKMRMKGNGVAIVTFGGGSGVLSADQAAFHGLQVPQLTPSTRAALAPLLPPIASTLNPVDLTPQVYQAEQWLDSLAQALDVIAADPGVDGMLLQYGPMASEAIAVANITREFIDRAPCPVLLAWGLPPAIIPPWMEKHGVNVFGEYERGVRVLGRLASASASIAPGAAPAPAAADFDWRAHLPAEGTVSGQPFRDLMQATGLAKSEEPAEGAAQIRVVAHRDPNFGVMIAVSARGRRAMHRAPVAAETAAGMLAGLGSELLPQSGVIAAFVSGLSALAASAPWRRFALVADPVGAAAQGVAVLDGMLQVDEA